MLGVLVGLRQEARIIRRFLPDVPIALSHADPERAKKETQRLLDVGCTKLLSFGCAGGLQEELAPGTVIIADRVSVNGEDFSTDAALSHAFGADFVLQGGVLHSDALVSTIDEKRSLARETQCLAVDMESGFVAKSGLPFAVLRVICDDAERDLPPAAVDGMKAGKVHIAGLLKSLIRRPTQIPSLIGMGRDVALAQNEILRFLTENPPPLDVA
ncbi:hypothetical protein AA106555_0969 [Neokomagataea thailandica NBRC 106555]|uniref:Nucleoside phosphorylase domain-containing protein n=2 Tax=Neokomagataea TaxID=1223423 RepID=A0A4Y6V8C3_9PROT|nr:MULTISPECIES: hypothetical protein [Neokomagataea]QDH25594.1 hypothetical protein D5366_10605 [Neokomagataea tanensis]GBR52595.1 hypothetical protein AA106555_0969 [Neokomagataea thailandica NBRC 106555]